MLTHGVSTNVPGGASSGGARARGGAHVETLMQSVSVGSPPEEEGEGEGEQPLGPVGTQGRWLDPSDTKAQSAQLRTHKVGVCIVPPEECWEGIQAIRRAQDRHYAKWMPHLNLLFPITCTDEELQSSTEKVRLILV